MATTEINTDSLVDWPIRLANLIIDFVVIFMLFIVVFIIAALINNDVALWLSTISDTVANVLGIIAMSVYYIVIELTTQRSVGKLVTGTMVVMEDGSRPKVKAIVIRTLCRFLPFEVFSFFKSYPRGWHDNASGTYVVNAKKHKEALRLKDAFSEIGIQQEF